jgi:hypothetical protein
MEIFPTRSALHDGGIALLEKKHLYFTIVVTDQQLEYLRKKLDVSKSDFDEKISKITAETGLRVEPDPLASKDNLPTALRRQLDKLVDGRLRNWDPLTEPMIREDMLEQFGQDIATMQALAARLNVEPLALVGNFDAPAIALAGLELVHLKSYDTNIHPAQNPWWMRRLSPQNWDLVGEPEAIFLIIVAFAVLIGFAWLSQKAFELGSPIFVGAASSLSKPALAAIFVPMGLALYYWRCRHLFTYGVAETLVGIGGIIDKVPDINQRDSTSAWATLVLGIYFVVRGLDNMAKAMGKTYKPAFLVNAWTKVFGSDSLG